MSLELPEIPKPGTTHLRKSFWDDARVSVLTTRKIQGRHVSVSEYPGKGTVINVDDTSARRSQQPISGCCPSITLLDSITALNLQFDLIGPCDCGTMSENQTWTRVSNDVTPGNFEFNFKCLEGIRARLNAMSPALPFPGPRLEFIVNDVPNSGDRLDVYFDFFDDDQPPCNWGLSPCIQAILHSCNATTIRACCICRDPDYCLNQVPVAIEDFISGSPYVFSDHQTCGIVTGEPCSPEHSGQWDQYFATWTLTVST